MEAIIQKWGNSQGIRLGKKFLSDVSLSVGDKTSIKIEDNKIIITKINKPKYKSLEERFANYQESYKGDEWDTGLSTGSEVW